MGQSIDWSQLIRIDKSWHTDVLQHHFTKKVEKTTVCLHSVRTTGNRILPDRLVKKLNQLMPEFVLGQKKVNEIGDPMEISFQTNQYFGNIDPEKDGKYGELLLFAMVESFLECKMVAHKVHALSSMNDQVKGGDGVFIGQYEVSPGVLTDAFLIGESKVVKNFYDGLADSFASLYRVHDPNTSYLFRQAEWLVAKNNAIDGDVNIDELYKRLDPDSEEFNNQTLIHPVLIMYDSGEIRKSENDSKTQSELEKLLSEKLSAFQDQMFHSITTQIEKYEEIQAIHLHFFMIPFNDVIAFRHAMYARLHNAEYRPKTKSDKK